MRYLVIGGGCVGLSLCVVLAEKGHSVVLCESDEGRRRGIVEGRLPFYEPVLSARLFGGVGRRIAVIPAVERAVCAAVDGVFICVGTPPGKDGVPDAQAVINAALSLPPLRRGAFIAVRSTVPVGTCDGIAAALWRRRVYNRVAFVPEFLREGTALEDACAPSRTVVGGAVGGLLKLWPDAIAMSLREAELVKLASNAYLAVRLAFFGELFDAARSFGASYPEIARAVGMDRRIGGEYMDVCAGFGGPCLEKDASAMAGAMGVVRAALESNARRRSAPVELLHKYYRRLDGLEIAVLGTAFKQGTDDARNSAGSMAAKALMDEGASVRTWDKLAKCTCATLKEAVAGARAALVFTPDAYELDVTGMAEPLVIDATGALDGRALERAGGVYEKLGDRAKRT